MGHLWNICGTSMGYPNGSYQPEGNPGRGSWQPAMSYHVDIISSVHKVEHACLAAANLGYAQKDQDRKPRNKSPEIIKL